MHNVNTQIKILLSIKYLPCTVSEVTWRCRECILQDKVCSAISDRNNSMLEYIKENVSPEELFEILL